MTDTTALQPDPAWARAAGHVSLGAPAPSDGSGALDRILVAERVHRYGWGYDERDRDALAGCFTDDAVWEGNIMGLETVGPEPGRDAVVGFLTDFWDQQADQRRHIFTNVVVDLPTPSTAVAHAYLLLTAAADATMQTVTTGPYRLELRKEDGDWLISRLSAGFDAPF